jgi:ribonucleoside-diphosphate reductase alpha chain
MMLKIEGKVVRVEVVQPDEAPPVTEAPVKPPKLWERPMDLHGVTTKIKPLDGSPALYVTINQGESGLVREIFINTNNAVVAEWTTALMRTASAVLRAGIQPEFLAAEWQDVVGPSGFWVKGKFFKSHVAAIGWCLERALRGEPDSVVAKNAHTEEHPKQTGKLCTNCWEYAVVKLDGCDTCTACLASTCG